MLDWNTYPTYQTYLAMMRGYAQTYPSLCRLDTFGVSVQGRRLLALRISDNVDGEEDEPEVLYTSSIHGDETVGYVLLLRLADYLLSLYGDDTPEGERATRMINEMEIWINPLANPDGTYWTSDSTVTGARRSNRNGVDLNRNFPDRLSDTVNTGAGRQVETRAAMLFAARRNIALSANFHGGAQVVNYPWDNGAPSGTPSICPDDAWFIDLSSAYATPNPDLMNGGFTNGITNGCAWYSVFGARQDWIYWWHGGRETTIELFDTKNPPGSLLPQRWTNNKEGLLAYLEFALRGVRGLVTDASTSAPVKARIVVQGLPTVPVFTDSAVGDYHRLLRPGTYTLIVTAPGYHPDTLRNLVVTGGFATRADVALVPLGTAVAGEPDGLPGRVELEQNYPNPFNPATAIRFQISDYSAKGGSASGGGFVSLRVYDLLGREVTTLVNEYRAPGSYTVTFPAEDGSASGADASHLSSGVYLYRLTTPGVSMVRRMVLLK
jgi:hypothetical protein